MTKSIIRLVLILLIITVNIGCDQFSKKIVKRSVLPYEMIHIFNDHLTVTRVENSGLSSVRGFHVEKCQTNFPGSDSNDRHGCWIGIPAFKTGFE